MLNKGDKLICDCCDKNEAKGVYSSSVGPVSFAYCDECMTRGVEPYGALIVFTATSCNSYENLNDSYKSMIDVNLEFYNKTVEDFNNDLVIMHKRYVNC